MKNVQRIMEYRPVRSSKARSVYDFCAVRGRDGAYRKSLRCAFLAFCREPTGVHWHIFGVHLLRMLLGDRLMNTILSDRATVITGIYRVNDESPCADGAECECMYHFAPTDCVDNIMANGLLPKDRFVYLTDTPHSLEQAFLSWKTGQIRATTAYTLLRVDVRQLSKTQTIFSTDRSHEFVTGQIDAKYICAVSDDRIGTASP